MGSHSYNQDRDGMRSKSFYGICVVLFLAACAFLMAASSCDDSKQVPTQDTTVIIHVTQ